MSSFYLVQEEDGTSKLLLEDDTGAILLEVILVAPPANVGGHPRRYRDQLRQRRLRMVELVARRTQRRAMLPAPPIRAPDRRRVPAETAAELVARARAEALVTLTEEGEEILALALLGML